MLLLLVALVMKRAPVRTRFPFALLAATLSMVGPVLLSTRPWGAGSVPAEEPGVRSEYERSPTDGSLLREGTPIPPTSGRFIMMGRRWAFVPDAAAGAEQDAGRDDQRSPAASDRAQEDLAGEIPSSAESRREPRAPTVYPARGTGSGEAGSANVESTEVGKAGSETERDAPESSSDPQPLELPQMLVVENLLLQRIVDAVRDDTIANRWTVTGMVTEYFGENRLILHTAQRADRR